MCCERDGKRVALHPVNTTVPTAWLRWFCNKRTWMVLSGSGKSSHENWTEKSQIILVFVPALCCFIRLYYFFVTDSFSLFFFLFSRTCSKYRGFYSWINKVKASPSPAFQCPCKSTAFFGRGVSGNKIGTRCCCFFFFFFMIVDKLWGEF